MRFKKLRGYCLNEGVLNENEAEIVSWVYTLRSKYVHCDIDGLAKSIAIAPVLDEKGSEVPFEKLPPAHKGAILKIIEPDTALKALKKTEDVLLSLSFG